ncbi:MAG: beta-N-acetylhexosaminidase [Pseudomonadales bacterium]|nr:beta-N-acetylhexosaminidase [Pseudomonadales bacterium]MCP5357405.1 beta-N-acetylhexosaminidase [Pseudomonadales bacterium]
MTQANPDSSSTTLPPGVLMLDLAGTALTDEERELLRSPVVGGVILFARNYVDPEQVQALNADIRACRPDILIAVDQEGGRVQRLRSGYTRLPPMARLAQLWHSDRVAAATLSEQAGWLMAAEMLSAGFDFSFAPVLDLDTGLSEVIGDRAFGSTPEQVAELARAFMRGMHEAGMATTGKHFPGHGSVQADSHLALPVDDRPLEQIRAFDLAPFVACRDLLDGIMPAHVLYQAVDPHCAGFSPFWLQTILRQELGFDGVIFSDDLVMAGAAAAGGIRERVDAALKAGCDMVLVCNDRAMALEAKAHLEATAHPGNSRLLRMRRARSWNREDLLGSDDWQQARARIDALMEAAT